jgi:gamma-butyrobetaine dioxygenase
VQLKERDLSIEWSNNNSVDLPYVFLRDNCQEPESFDHSARQRLFNPAFTIDLNIQAKQAELREDGRLLTISWPDGHRSRFESEWLAKYCKGKHDMSGKLGVERVYWGSDFYDKMPRFDYVKLMEDDGSLLKYLIALESHGLVLVENVGTELNQVKNLCDHIYYPKPTVYGKDITKLDTRHDPQRIAIELHLHNNFVCYEYKSGISMMHFVRRLPVPIGGLLRFSDGVNVAKELKDKNPTAFDMLTQYPIQFIDSGTDVLGDFDVESWHYPISVDKNGDVSGITYSNHVRSSHFPHTLMDKLHDWYAAYYAFSHLLHSPKYLLEFKAWPGQMVVFDNMRVLHGQTEYQLKSGEDNDLELCYMDWDELRSKARVLMKKLSYGL